MKRTLLSSTVVAAGLAALALFTLHASSGPSADTKAAPSLTVQAESDHARRPIDAHRQFAAMLNAPGRSAQEHLRLLEQSDAIREQLAEGGEDDVGVAMRSRLRDVEVSNEEARQWFDEHRETFGTRSFEQSRYAIDRLIAIERVRDEFQLEED